MMSELILFHIRIERKEKPPDVTDEPKRSYNCETPRNSFMGMREDVTIISNLAGFVHLSASNVLS